VFLREAFEIAAEAPNLKPFFQRKAFTLSLLTKTYPRAMDL